MAPVVYAGSISHVSCGYPRRLLNMHHSFVPGFTEARPYHGAFERGVKLTGPASHYVIDALDEGPLIEQEVARASFRGFWCSPAAPGHRILFYGNKGAIFD